MVQRRKPVFVGSQTDCPLQSNNINKCKKNLKKHFLLTFYFLQLVILRMSFCLTIVSPYHSFLLPLCPPLHGSHITPPHVLSTGALTACLPPKPPCFLPTISEMDEWMGQRRSNSTALTNGLCWQLHLLAIVKCQSCSRTLAADLYSRTLSRLQKTSLSLCSAQDELPVLGQPVWNVTRGAQSAWKSMECWSWSVPRKSKCQCHWFFRVNDVPLTNLQLLLIATKLNGG